MQIGILKESTPNETRVAIAPKTVEKLVQMKCSVSIESGAGVRAAFPDSEYLAVGATLMDRSALLQCDLVAAINPLSDDELGRVKHGSIVLGLYQPYNDPGVVARLGNFPEIYVLSLDMMPRTTLAQAMDVLSSMASIAGYQAVLVGATLLPRYFPMLITAAGSIPPAKVLILGAGVAGLQAIATARRLGAVVEAFDTRAAAKEEVLSLGAKFVEVEGAVDDRGAGGYAVEQSEDFLSRQRAEVQARAAKADIVICTAQVRGRKAPILVTADTVQNMRPGSVIIDLASSTGGNCELTKDNETIQVHGVTILGDSNLAARQPSDASTLLGNNILNLLKVFVDKNGQANPDWNHEILKAIRVGAPAAV